MSTEDWLALNRSNWDERVGHHVRSDFYDVDGFKAGELSLGAREIADLGDVVGKDLVHLQCHFGLDTLSWARLGANVTGLDFSGSAMVEARTLAIETGLDARFVEANVYDAVDALRADYDIVYTGLGALCWLPDITAWAQVVASLLRPGGQLYLVEFHPTEWIFDDDGTGVAYDYFTDDQGLQIVDSATYANADAQLQADTTKQWNHSLGSVVTALVDAGLEISSLREDDTSYYQVWPILQKGDDGLYRMPADQPNRPLMYTLRASIRR